MNNTQIIDKSPQNYRINTKNLNMSKLHLAQFYPWYFSNIRKFFFEKF